MTKPISSEAPGHTDGPPREQIARRFEELFAGQLTQLLLDQVEVDSTFGGGHGEEQFRGILAEEMGKAIARSGLLALTPAVLTEIQRIEEGQ